MHRQFKYFHHLIGRMKGRAQSKDPRTVAEISVTSPKKIAVQLQISAEKRTFHPFPDLCQKSGCLAVSHCGILDPPSQILSFNVCTVILFLSKGKQSAHPNGDILVLQK